MSEVEKFGDDRAYAPEVAGAARAAEPLREKLLVDVDP
mgnify:FL=1